MMTGIEPRLVTIFGIWTSILLMIAGVGPSFFEGALPAAWAAVTVKWCAILGAINSVILTGGAAFSSAKPGPLVNSPAVAPTAVAPELIKLVVLALALSACLPTNAQAQSKKPAHAASDLPVASDKCLIPWDPLKLCGALSGKLDEDFQRVVKRIQAVQRADIGYAILKAKAANTAASAVRLQCLQAIADANDQFNGAGLKDAGGAEVARPDPAVVTAIEDTAELVDNLSPQGKLFTACAGAAQMFKTTTLTLVNAIVTGAAGIAALPAGL
jgi:hypothetical protein